MSKCRRDSGLNIRPQFGNGLTVAFDRHPFAVGDSVDNRTATVPQLSHRYPTHST
jgi:hypothetical protein